LQLILNALESVRDYYQIALKDYSRNGITRRRVILESVSGSHIRKACQLSQLAEFLGARKATLLESSKSRSSAEDQQKLKPLVEMLGRKPPEGERVVSLSWKIKAGQFFEQDSCSDIVKGTHCMYKVCYFVNMNWLWVERSY
jgi:hypothetical protein